MIYAFTIIPQWKGEGTKKLPVTTGFRERPQVG